MGIQCLTYICNLLLGRNMQIEPWIFRIRIHFQLFQNANRHEAYDN